MLMCSSPDVPPPPPPPPEAPDYEAVSGKRKRGDERRRQLAGYGDRGTILTGTQGAAGMANTGKTVLGG
jgi:hypothetical protein